MKTTRYFAGFSLALALSISKAPAHEAHKKEAEKGGAQASSEEVGKPIAITEKDAAWAGKARKEYPLEVCLTSGDKLDGMGKSPEYVFRVDSKLDRFLVFCCDGCEEDFMKEPDKYLATIRYCGERESQREGC